MHTSSCTTFSPLTLYRTITFTHRKNGERSCCCYSEIHASHRNHQAALSVYTCSALMRTESSFGQRGTTQYNVFPTVSLRAWANGFGQLCPVDKSPDPLALEVSHGGGGGKAVPWRSCKEHQILKSYPHSSNTPTKNHGYAAVSQQVLTAWGWPIETGLTVRFTCPKPRTKS